MNFALKRGSPSSLAPQGFFAAPLLLTPIHSSLATPSPHTRVAPSEVR